METRQQVLTNIFDSFTLTGNFYSEFVLVKEWDI